MSKQADPPKEKPRSITINFSDNDPEKETPREPKQSHICIFGDCKKGKRGGTDYCRTHKPISAKQPYGTSTKKTYNKSTKTNSKKSSKRSKVTPAEDDVIKLKNPNLGRVEKALLGIILMICGPLIATQRTFFDDDFYLYCTCCFILMGTGFSLVIQSLHKEEVKTSTGIYYFFLFFALIVIFTFASLLLF